jgi:hypothetical protein
MRTGDSTIERIQIPLPKNYPWGLVRHLTEASSYSEVLRHAVVSYFELFDCERVGTRILLMGKDGVYSPYAPSVQRHLGLSRMNLNTSLATRAKIEFMAAASAKEPATLIRDALDFYKQIVIETAFERPIVAEHDDERTVILFASLLNVANMAKRIGLGTKTPEMTPS